jgi:hypothetical protein
VGEAVEYHLDRRTVTCAVRCLAILAQLSRQLTNVHAELANVAGGPG